MAKENKTKLSEKQKRFCEEYVIDLNATQAAIRSGYSEKTARSQGQRLLTNVDIQKFISELRKDIQERNKITVDECISILASIARLDVADIYAEDGTIKPLSEIPKEARIAIAGIESTELFDFDYDKKEKIFIGHSKKLRTVSKEGAIDKLLKHFGGYEKDKPKDSNNIVVFSIPDNGRNR